MKRRGKNLLIVLFSFLAVLIFSVTFNLIRKNQEKKYLTPLGQTVIVNNNKMSIYIEGNGPKTFVFMSGGGTCSPILDFKSLYSLLSKNNKIIVVEKFGYGFSDITSDSRDIDSILSDTRQALKAANISGPYILVPHSLSGIEALYWAQNYPEEVEAIVGLDMATPNHYKELKVSMPGLYFGKVFHQLGGTRFLPGIWKGEAVKYGTLTEEEKNIYKAVFFSRTGTKNMIEEAKSIYDNSNIVASKELPQIPMLLFMSNGLGTGIKEEIWHNCYYDFASKINNCRIVEYNVPHYIHNHKYNEISMEIKTFIDKL